MDRKPQLNSLNGLRFLAILVVFVQHIGGHFGIPRLGVGIGHEATVLFFLLSGFVLQYAYADGFAVAGKLRNYMFSRWAKMWPLHAFCTTIAVLLLSRVPGYFSEPDWPAILFSNLLLVHAWIPLDSWVLSFNSVSWFLSVVTFGYLLFPLLVSDTRKIWTVLGVWLVSLFLVIPVLANLLPESWASMKQNFILFHPLVRGPEFLLGMALGNWYLESRQLKRPARPMETRFRMSADTGTTGQFVEGSNIDDLKVVQASRREFEIDFVEDSEEMDVSSTDTAIEFLTGAIAIGLLASLLILNWSAQLTSSPAIGNMIGLWIRTLVATVVMSVVIWGFAGRSGALSLMLGSKPANYLGTITFAFYLTHQLVIRALHFFHWHTDAPWPAAAVLLTVISLSVAVLIHHLVELPTRTLMQRLEHDANAEDLPTQAAWRETLAALKAAVTRVATGIRNPVAMVSFAALFLAAAAVYGSHSPEPVVQPKRYVAQPLFGHAPIRFREEAILHGLQANRTDQGIQLVMFWERLPSAKRNRSWHLLDSSGSIKGYGRQDQDAFLAHSSGQVFREELLIENEQLQGVRTVGLGFFHPEHKGAPVSRGPRGLNGRRLEIDLNQLP